MTTIELLKQPAEVENAYFLDLQSPDTQVLLNYVVATKQPYADAATNPDLGSKAIYIFDGREFGSDLGRIAESNVLKSDPKWGQSPEVTAKDMQPLEDNSRFFVLVDYTDNGPELVGSLRVADCGNGPSETEGFYRENFGAGVEMPNELGMPRGRNGVWDIVYVVVRDEYQDGINSAWLYYAMHKNSVETGQREWISNITDDEFKMLKTIGIPFKQIEGTEKVSVKSSIQPDAEHTFGFYHTMLDGVAESVDKKASVWEQRGGSAAFLGKIALISRYGSETRPVVYADTDRLAS